MLLHVEVEQQGQQAPGPVLVERLVPVAALRRLDARRAPVAHSRIRRPPRGSWRDVDRPRRSPARRSPRRRGSRRRSTMVGSAGVGLAHGRDPADIPTVTDREQREDADGRMLDRVQRAGPRGRVDARRRSRSRFDRVPHPSGREPAWRAGRVSRRTEHLAGRRPCVDSRSPATRPRLRPRCEPGPTDGPIAVDRQHAHADVGAGDRVLGCRRTTRRWRPIVQVEVEDAVRRRPGACRPRPGAPCRTRGLRRRCRRGCRRRARCGTRRSNRNEVRSRAPGTHDRPTPRSATGALDVGGRTLRRSSSDEGADAVVEVGPPPLVREGQRKLERRATEMGAAG